MMPSRFTDELFRFESGWSKFVGVFLVNTAIALFIALVLFMASMDLSIRFFGILLLVTAIYSQCIGFLVCYSLGSLYRPLRSMATLAAVPLLSTLLFAAGVAGTWIGRVLQVLVIPQKMLPKPLQGSLRWVDYLVGGIICVVVGCLIFVYRLFRDRWESANERLRAQELLQERLWKLKAEAELGALQARIHPHFLFNTLNSIASLVRESPETAESVIEKLSGLFRYSLASSRGATVRLDEELRFISDYLEIEKVRLGRRLRFTIVADEASKQVRLPGLLVQPLVENAVQHGIGPKEEGGEIRVTARAGDGRCTIEVVDDGAGFTEADAGAGYALQNIRERLQVLYPSDHRLEIGSLPDGRTRVLLDIPDRQESGP